MNAKTKKNGNKGSNRKSPTQRSYIVARRVILRGGVPILRGRPSTDAKGKLTAVFVLEGENYDVTKHGIGTPYRRPSHPLFKHIKKSTLSNAPVDVAPEVVVEAPVAEVASTEPVTA